MKIIEWIIALFLVLVGVACLTLSATWMFNPDTIQSYLATLFQICFWIAIPTIIGIVIYLVYQRKKGDS
jgi:hypothetical protein